MKNMQKVIWGHTQISSKNGLPFVHFTICHLMERYISQQYRSQGMFQHKDTFLSAMTDIILLKEVKKPGSSGVMDIWQTPKKEGGLGWINQATIQEFMTEFGQ